MPVISVLIPTVTGREEHFTATLGYYADRCSPGVTAELVTVLDHPAVGHGWQACAERSTGDYLHFTNDDIEPLPGWDVAAVAAADAGVVPAPRVTDARNGRLQSRPYWDAEFPDDTPTGISVLPFLSRAMWDKVQPLLTCHYYTDDFISVRAARNGWPSLMRNGYAFRHHWAEHRRGAGMTEPERMQHDYNLYAQALGMADRGEWVKPWPEAGR